MIQAQISTIVFEDDFSSNAIDPATYEQATPFFEGGEGDIHAEAGDGVMRFVGTTTQQWWSGGTLNLKQSFQATTDTPVTVSIDRVAEAGQGHRLHEAPSGFSMKRKRVTFSLQMCEERAVGVTIVKLEKMATFQPEEETT